MYDNYSPEVYSAVPPAAGRVLEFGCATGRLGGIYLEKNPGASWTGVDPDGEAIEIAKGRLSAAHVGTVESYLASASVTEEVIIMADVIEHVANPAAVLERIVNDIRVKKETSPSYQPTLIFSIPNVQHWSVINSLLDGRFPRTQEGILDRTHLHFFTLTEIVDLLTGAGLNIKAVRPMIPPHGNAICTGWERKEGLLEWISMYSKIAGRKYDARKYEATQYLCTCTV